MQKVEKMNKNVSYMVREESGVPPMLSGHFSGSVVVTANLQKNMNPKSLLMALKQVINSEIETI